MKKHIVTIIFALLIIVVAGLLIYEKIQEKNAPSTEVQSLSEYYTVKDGRVMLIFDDKVYDKSGLWFEEHPYLDLDTVLETFNHRFFWSKEENLLVYTTPSEVIQIVPGEKEIKVNDVPKQMPFAPAALSGESLYISIEYLADYADYTYKIYNDPNRVVLNYKWGEYLYSDVTEATQIRTASDIKAPLIKELEVGDRVMYIDGGGIQQNGFVKVMSEDGVRGYAKTDFLSDSYYAETKSSYKAPEYTHITNSDPIYLGFELIYTSENVGFLKEHLNRAPEVNVVSPTWFFMAGTEGEMQSYANTFYVEEAHSRGVQVWALYKNDSIDGQFSCVEDTHTLLSTFESRHKLIDAMIESVHTYNIDGINMDFEALKAETGKYYVQFLRELSVSCRREGIILSVDNYVPAHYNTFYDLEEQGQVIDYVVMMGYDEHYSGSEEAGSVSSLPWYGESIDNTCALVSPSQIVFALPFYTRIWKEVKDSAGNVSVSVAATPNMASAKETLAAYGKKAEWDEETGQNYGEYEKGGATYRVWLEDEESIAKKVELIGANGLAGVAAWKLGDENPGIWSVISETYNESKQ